MFLCCVLCIARNNALHERANHDDGDIIAKYHTIFKQVHVLKPNLISIYEKNTIMLLLLP